MKTVYLGCGANVSGSWGSPQQTLLRLTVELARRGVSVTGRSSTYATKPLGRTRQPDFLNIILAVHTSLPPAMLLRDLKRHEYDAGRRPRGLWMPRPLDIDIIDYGGRIIGWSGRSGRVAGRLILPHPEAHKRAFVLVPLLEAAPSWRHPALDAPVTMLKARLGPAAARQVKRRDVGSEPDAFTRRS